MPFVSKKEKESREKNYRIGDYYDRRDRSGEIGMEIEVEGRNLPTAPPAEWRPVRDGSLRGTENMEYVFDGPKMFDQVDGLVDELWKKFAENKARLDASNRTSVHVHLNVNGFYLNRFTSLCALWFVFEDFLAHWCGEHRVGNLFCLRAKDAPAIIGRIRAFILNNMNYRFSEGLHYAGFNTHAVAKFGSVEVRFLRGCTEPETIKTWVRILRRIYEASAAFEDPRRVVENLSFVGASQFMAEILGPYGNQIQQEIRWTDDQVINSLFDGARLAQDFVYVRDWSQFRKDKVERDPFGRRVKPKSAGLQRGFDEDGVEADMDADDDMEDDRRVEPVPEPQRPAPTRPNRRLRTEEEINALADQMMQRAIRRQAEMQPRPQRPAPTEDWDHFFNNVFEG